MGLCACKDGVEDKVGQQLEDSSGPGRLQGNATAECRGLLELLMMVEDGRTHGASQESQGYEEEEFDGWEAGVSLI